MSRTPPLVPSPEALLEDFNRYRRMCAIYKQRRESGEYSRDFVLKPERAVVFREFCGWCFLRDYEPHLFLYAVFVGRRWYWPPQIRLGDLTSEKSEAAYRKLNARALDGYRRFQAMRASGKQERLSDPMIDLLPQVEERKRNLLVRGQSGLCMQEMVEETYGFHPKSEICLRCPLGEDCKVRLDAYCRPIPMQMLRSGQLSIEDAKRMARGAMPL